MRDPFIGVETNVDLRKVNWNEDVLNKWARVYKVGEGKSFLFVNKSITRMRCIQRRNGLVELLIPPMNKKNARNNKTLIRICDSYLGGGIKVGDTDYTYLTLNEIRELAENRIAISKARKRKKKK